MYSETQINSTITHKFCEKYGTNSLLTFERAFNDIVIEQLNLFTTINSNEYFIMFNNIKNKNKKYASKFDIYNEFTFQIFNIITSVFFNTYLIDISDDGYVLNYICNKCYERNDDINLVIKYYTKSFTLNDFVEKLDNIVKDEYRKLKDYIYDEYLYYDNLLDEQSINKFSKYFNENEYTALYFFNENRCCSQLSNEILKSLYVSCVYENVEEVIKNDDIIKKYITKTVYRNIKDYVYNKINDIVDIPHIPYFRNAYGLYFEGHNFKNFCNSIKSCVREVYDTHIIYSIQNDFEFDNNYDNLITFLKYKLYPIAYIMYDIREIEKELDHTEDVLSSARDSIDVSYGSLRSSSCNCKIENIKKEIYSIIDEVFGDIE